MVNYKGNYDRFRKTINKKLKQQEKDWNKIEKKVKKMKKSGKKKNEINDLIKKSGVVKPEKPYKPLNVEFEEVNHARGSLIQLKNITFGWDEEKILFEDVILTKTFWEKFSLNLSQFV